MTEHHHPPANSHSHHNHSHHGHAHHAHAHHDHSHDGHNHHDAVKSSAHFVLQKRVMPPASFFALSAVQRLAYVMPFIALIWLGLFWAMREGA